MTEIALLEQRRKLVALSAQLQRATLARRLAYVQNNPGRVVLDAAVSAARSSEVRRAAVVVALFAWRALKGRGARGQTPARSP